MFSFGISQELNLSFSQHISCYKDYKPLSCFSFNSNNILFQKKTNSKSCDLKVNVFDSHLDEIKRFNVVLNDEMVIYFLNFKSSYGFLIFRKNLNKLSFLLIGTLGNKNLSNVFFLYLDL